MGNAILAKRFAVDVRSDRVTRALEGSIDGGGQKRAIGEILTHENNYIGVIKTWGNSTSRLGYHKLSNNNLPNLSLTYTDPDGGPSYANYMSVDRSTIGVYFIAYYYDNSDIRCDLVDFGTNNSSAPSAGSVVTVSRDIQCSDILCEVGGNDGYILSVRSSTNYVYNNLTIYQVNLNDDTLTVSNPTELYNLSGYDAFGAAMSAVGLFRLNTCFGIIGIDDTYSILHVRTYNRGQKNPLSDVKTIDISDYFTRSDRFLPKYANEVSNGEIVLYYDDMLCWIDVYDGILRTGLKIPELSGKGSPSYTVMAKSDTTYSPEFYLVYYTYSSGLEVYKVTANTGDYTLRCEQIMTLPTPSDITDRYDISRAFVYEGYIYIVFDDGDGQWLFYYIKDKKLYRHNGFLLGA